MSGCIQEKEKEGLVAAYRGDCDIKIWQEFGRHAKPVLTDKQSLVRLTNIASTLLLGAPAGFCIADLKEAMKDEAAANGITYNSDLISKALNEAERMRYAKMGQKSRRTAVRPLR
jgi:hypothetical protein